MTGARGAEVRVGAPRDAHEDRPAPAVPEAVPGGAGRLALHLLAGAAAAVAVSAATQAVVARLPAPHPSNVPAALIALAAVVGTAAVLAAAAAPRLPRGALAAGVVLLSGLSTLVLALPLNGTSYYLGGNTEDQTFRAQYLGRLADDWRLADMNYADVEPFYPAGWFWVAGRFAALTGTPSWEAFKPVAIATVAVVPCLVALAWARLSGPRRGLLAGLVTVAVPVQQSGSGAFAGEPYSWCLAALVPVVAVVAVRALEPARVAGRGRAAALLGVLLGLAAMTYTLYAGFAALAVAAACALGVVRGWRAGEGPAALRTRVPALVLAAVVSAALAALVWAPWVLERLTAGGGTSAAQRFLPAVSAVLPTPMLEATPWGALLLAGTAWLLLRARTDATARGLLLVAVLVYAWYLLSTLALAAGTTLLAFRMEAVLEEVLAVAGVLAAADAVRAVRAARSERVLRLRRPAAVLAALAGAAVVVGTLQQAPAAMARGLDHAWNDYGADGRTATGQRDEAANGAWTPDLLRAVDEMTGDRPADDLVVLSSVYELATFSPYRGYQQMTPHYANPLARFDERRAQVEDWARATDGEDLVRRLDSGPFRAPDVFVLHRGAAGLEIGVTRDLFPAEPNVGWSTVVLDPALFDAGHFDVREVGPFTVAVRRS